MNDKKHWAYAELKKDSRSGERKMRNLFERVKYALRRNMVRSFCSTRPRAQSLTKRFATDISPQSSPSLSIEFRISGRREYTLSFSWGRGSAVGMEQVITESVKKHLAIIQAVNRLELEWGSLELFSALSARIIAMYEEDVF